jgi:hypothetical protein
VKTIGKLVSVVIALTSLGTAVSTAGGDSTGKIPAIPDTLAIKARMRDIESRLTVKVEGGSDPTKVYFHKYGEKAAGLGYHCYPSFVSIESTYGIVLFSAMATCTGSKPLSMKGVTVSARNESLSATWSPTTPIPLPDGRIMEIGTFFPDSAMLAPLTDVPDSVPLRVTLHGQATDCPFTMSKLEKGMWRDLTFFYRYREYRSR